MKDDFNAVQPTNQFAYTPPTDLVVLPSGGKFYPETHPLYNKAEVEIYYMTTKQEDILSSEAYNRAGTVFDKLIESLLVDRSIRVESLLLGDKNAIVVNARKNAYGEEYKVKVDCGNCFADTELAINLDEIEPKITNYDDVTFTDKGTFILTMPKLNVGVELKLLTSKDEKEIVDRAEQKSKHSLPEEPVTDRYRQMIVSVNGNDSFQNINNFIKNMPIASSAYLKKRYGQLVPDLDFVYSFQCEHCEQENKGGVPITGDFFWPDI